MTWKLYALASGGAFLATYAMSLGPSVGPANTPEPSAQQPAEIEYEVPSDFLEQAERLRARLSETPEYRQPERNAFRFGAAPRSNPPESSADAAPALAPPVVIPPRPPFSLAGIASDVVDGVTIYTAILSSFGGVLLVGEGDVVSGGYRVLRVDEAGVTVELPGGGGEQVTVRLSGQ
jgi:hypothetical protein